jgi:hypothetical protein
VLVLLLRHLLLWVPHGVEHIRILMLLMPDTAAAFVFAAAVLA